MIVTSKKFDWNAKWSGVLPYLFLKFGFAFWDNKKDTISEFDFFAATWSGVFPYLSLALKSFS